MPDNWNILASLLGTPKPPDRPAAKVEPEKPAAEPEPSAESCESKEKESDAAPKPKETSETAPAKASAFSSDDEGADDVLQALAAVKPPPKLPGFGVADDDDSDDVPSGFGVAENKISKRESQLKTGGDESPASKRDRKHRGGPDLGEPPRKKGNGGGGGFASGLLGNDDFDDEDASDVEAFDDESDLIASDTVEITGWDADSVDEGDSAPPQSPIEIGTRVAEDVADAADVAVMPTIHRTSPANRSQRNHRRLAEVVVAVVVNDKKCPIRTSS